MRVTDPVIPLRTVLSGGGDAPIVRIESIGTGSLLLSTGRYLSSTPRVLRLGLGGSLLSMRLRRAVARPPIPACSVPRPCPSSQLSAPPRPPEIESTDRVWPSDLRTDETERTEEIVVPVRIELAVGNFLDIWL